MTFRLRAALLCHEPLYIFFLVDKTSRPAFPKMIFFWHCRGLSSCKVFPELSQSAKNGGSWLNQTTANVQVGNSPVIWLELLLFIILFDFSLKMHSQSCIFTQQITPLHSVILITKCSQWCVSMCEHNIIAVNLRSAASATRIRFYNTDSNFLCSILS